MDIAAWLRGLGLERYEAAFRENEIDWALLPKLTADDLKDLGIGLVGHRRKLLEAIAELSAADVPPDPIPPTAPNDVSLFPTPGTSFPGARPGAPAHTAETRAAVEAERRQLTIMFCDLVGSTPLSTRLDPEDLRDVIGAYHRAVAEVVGSFEGFVAKYMGDGVLAYFGYPRAHEDDAERAVRAGLALVEAVPRLELVAQVGLQVRIGIATGLVVVGDLTGIGRGAGARCRWRNPQSRGPPADRGAARHGCDRVEHAAADRRPLRLQGAWRCRAQRLRRTSQRMAGAGREQGRGPV